MSDVQSTMPAPGNTAEARNSDGSLKDQTPKLGETKPENTDTQTKTPEELAKETEALKAAEAAKAAEGKKPEPGVVPEKYEFKLPDGVALDEKVVGEVTTLFKELKIPQDAAQKLMDFHTAQLKTVGEAGINEYQKTREGWRAEIAADKEIGSKLPEVKASIGRMYDGLGDAGLVGQFKEAMDLTGVGDHPAFVKLFYKLATRFAEGKPADGKGPSQLGQTTKDTPRSAAQAMYPNLPSANG